MEGCGCAILLVSEQRVVVEFVVILLNGGLDLGAVDPGDEVLERARHEESGIRDHLGTHAHVALLDERHGLLQGLTHVQTNHHHRKTAPGERRKQEDEKQESERGEGGK